MILLHLVILGLGFSRHSLSIFRFRFFMTTRTNRLARTLKLVAPERSYTMWLTEWGVPLSWTHWLVVLIAIIVYSLMPFILKASHYSLRRPGMATTLETLFIPISHNCKYESYTLVFGRSQESRSQED
jgi:hypothetical protein